MAPAPAAARQVAENLEAGRAVAASIRASMGGLLTPASRRRSPTRGRVPGRVVRRGRSGVGRWHASYHRRVHRNLPLRRVRALRRVRRRTKHRGGRRRRVGVRARVARRAVRRGRCDC